MKKNKYYIVKLIDEETIVREDEETIVREDEKACDPDLSYQIMRVWDCKPFDTPREAIKEVMRMKEKDHNPYLYGVIKGYYDPEEDKETF